jgi:hypothetical protein
VTPLPERGRVSPAAIGLLVALPLCLYLGLSAVTPQPDPDSYWLATAGRWMLAHARVPRENLFSFTAPTHPWVMHEWGAAPLYAWGLSLAGPVFLVWLTVATAWGVRVLIAAAVLRDAPSLRVAVGMLLLATFALGSPLSGSRPSTWSLALVAAMALIAYRPTFDPRLAAAAVLLELLWTNLHGSFPLGVALLLAAALDLRERRRARLLTAAAAAAVTALNPYGLALHAHVLGYVLGDGASYRWVHHHIVEFLPLFGGGLVRLNAIDLGGLALVLLLALAALVRGPRRAAALLCLGLLCLGVFTVRYLPLAAAVGCALLTPSPLGAPPRALGEERRRVRAIYVALPLAVALVCHAGAAVDARPGRWEAELLGGADVPALAREIPDGSRLYAPFYVTSRVLWETADRGVRVFFDLRNDCYPPAVAEAALHLGEDGLAPERARAVLARYGVDHALLPDRGAVAGALVGRPWARVIDARGGYALWALSPRDAASAGR